MNMSKMRRLGRNAPEDRHLLAIERRLKRRRKFQIKKKPLSQSFFRDTPKQYEEL